MKKLVMLVRGEEMRMITACREQTQTNVRGNNPQQIIAIRVEVASQTCAVVVVRLEMRTFVMNLLTQTGISVSQETKRMTNVLKIGRHRINAQRGKARMMLVLRMALMRWEINAQEVTQQMD